MYNACHANHTHICWRKKKINKASFAEFFGGGIKKYNFFYTPRKNKQARKKKARARNFFFTALF